MDLGERVLWRPTVPPKERRNKLDTDVKEGVYLGQRTVPGEYLIGSKEGIFRPRTVYRVPVESRWKDNLSFVTGLPWKHNEKHDAGEEVVLDTNPPEPSMEPVTTPLPPTMMEEPMGKAVRRLYVKLSDLDPSCGGIGFTEGCKGCKSIISGGGNGRDTMRSAECG